jgi:eukaryotic-like serine/threonine-protein kinase
VPARVRQVLRVCLQKDPKQRAQAMGDVRLALEGAFETVVAQAAVSAARSQPAWRRAVPWAVAIVAIVATSVMSGAAVWILARPAPVAVPGVQRLTMPLPETAPYVGEIGGGLAISPDGTRLVYAGGEGGKRLLYTRLLDQLESRPIPGTEDAYNPFFSSDGEWIAFFTYAGSTTPANKLKKVAVRGGPPLTLCDAPIPAGGTWGKDGVIVFATASDGTSAWKLQQVPAAGGVPKDLAEPDAKKKETRYGWPELLPGGKAVLFSIATSRNTFDESHVAVLSLETGTYHTVVEQGFRAHYVPTGHIVYMLGGNLMAVPFDAGRLEATGPPVPLVEGVRGRMLTGEFGFAVSSTGFLVYAPGGVSGGNQHGLVWVDRQGHEEPLKVPLRAYTLPRLSPDGKRIALDIRDQENDIWT